MELINVHGGIAEVLWFAVEQEVMQVAPIVHGQVCWRLRKMSVQYVEDSPDPTNKSCTSHGHAKGRIAVIQPNKQSDCPNQHTRQKNIVLLTSRNVQ